MKTILSFVAAALFLTSAGGVWATTRYVDVNGASPTPPYTNWATAATTIQVAVDAAVAADEIVVTNGIYSTGGRAVGTNVLVSRVAVTKPLALRSVNGPEFTVIQGAKSARGGNGVGTIRCVYLATGASLSGFTLTNGATRTDGDWSLDESGGGVWCQSTNARVANCTIAGNSAYNIGGGSYSGTLNNCTLTANSARGGGGATYGTLNNCTLSGNSADYSGGGASDGTLNNCTLTGNSAATYSNGFGGQGGGACRGTLNNCIVYFNTAVSGANYSGGTLNYCCTTPLPTNGVGNITADPELASVSHLSIFSPCRGAGSAAYATGTDIDGELWANPPSIGCDEYHDGAVTGPLNVNIGATYTKVAVGFPVGLTARIEGRTALSIWNFGDGTLSLDQPFETHTWTAPGDYLVTLWAFNESHPDGVSGTVIIRVLMSPTHYVATDSANPVPPYTSWTTAATNIQDAVDQAYAGGEVVVSNGVYTSRGVAAERAVTVAKPLTLRSVNGPQFTVIQGRQVPGITNGNGAIRCVYLVNGTSLSGFTLTNGATWTNGNYYPYSLDESGGGVWCESTNVLVTNCIIAGNSAVISGGAYRGTLNHCALAGNWASYYGGGASQSTLNDCSLSTNSATGYGGGACGGTLNNCTLSGNSAWEGGGSYGQDGFPCTLNNCTLSGNSAREDGGGAYGGMLNNCTLTGNSASEGGGAFGHYSYARCTLKNCTLTGNSASYGGGGAAYGTLNNCIVHFNTAPNGPNFVESEWISINYSCTTPLPTNGVGNIGTDPELASASHLSIFSPCRAAGSATYTSGVDIDGEPWANPPSMGCDEYHAGAVTGPLSVGIGAAYTNVAVGYPLNLEALIDGRVSLSIWDFDDGDLEINEPFTTHAWTAPGDYVVSLWALNDSQPEWVRATLPIHVTPGLHYVVADSANPVSPYTAWATAATTIQDAVDAAVPGGTVAVSNGVYATGGRAVGTNLLINRVVVEKPLTLRSVNGPQVTVIQGHQVPGATNGDGATRCVYLADGASLSGFTLTNGATRTNRNYYSDRSGGGLWCESATVAVSNCVMAGNSACDFGGGVYQGTLNNCTLMGNSAYEGGGAYCSTLNHCTLSGNSASASGGGASGYFDYWTWVYAPCTLNHCTLRDNSADYGGGASLSSLNNCTLSGNSAESGGGVYQGTLNNCTLTGNSAYEGGAVYQSTLHNCALIANSADDGGGAYYGTLDNCTLTGNSATNFGGGEFYSSLNNCIVYFNTAPNGSNFVESESSYINLSCTTPLATNGVGNMSTDPQLASASHLSASSPCRGAGSINYATGTDIDGEPWANPPSIGCDEYHAGAVTGPLSVEILAAYTNVALGYPVGLIALTEGRTTMSVWEFGDGTMATNQPCASHAWTALGDYPVVLRAYNESHPDGVSATVTVHVVRSLHYVAADSANPVAPYTSWATAAKKIQDAVDTAVPGGTVVVTNGVYATGGRAVDGAMTNRVAVDKPLTLRSVNGPQVTVIQGRQVPGTTNGDGAIRCVYLASGASLFGFTLTNGATRSLDDYEDPRYRETGGGGLWCASADATVSNCVVAGNSAYDSGGGAYRGTLYDCALTGNSASHGSGGGACGGTLNNCALTRNYSAWYGGGACDGTLNNCALTDNSADDGGGAYQATLSNCTLVRNSARYGGGVYYATLNNCIVYFNSATKSGPNYYAYDVSELALNYCCTTPLPATGVGNMTRQPLFVDYAHRNLRLQSNSPCINAGNNAYASGPTDLDGNPRIVGGTVDMGAYECQSPALLDYYTWLQTYGLPTGAAAVYVDSDGDRLNNWQEWRCQTNPTNALSVLWLLAPESDGTNVAVRWESVAGVNYVLERSTNLAAPFTLVATNILGQAGTTIYLDTNAASLSPQFYRVGVP